MTKKINGLTEAKYQKLINDIKSEKYKNTVLIDKYKMTSAAFYSLTTKLRSKGLIPESIMSEKLKNAFAGRNSSTTDNSVKKPKSSDKVNVTINEFRTVYFKDFSVQIHKKALARLVVDQHNNLHILNN